MPCVTCATRDQINNKLENMEYPLGVSVPVPVPVLISASTCLELEKLNLFLSLTFAIVPQRFTMKYFFSIFRFLLSFAFLLPWHSLRFVSLWNYWVIICLKVWVPPLGKCVGVWTRLCMSHAVNKMIRAELDPLKQLFSPKWMSRRCGL